MGNNNENVFEIIIPLAVLGGIAYVGYKIVSLMPGAAKSVGAATGYAFGIGARDTAQDKANAQAAMNKVGDYNSNPFASYMYQGQPSSNPNLLDQNTAQSLAQNLYDLINPSIATTIFTLGAQLNNGDEVTKFFQQFKTQVQVSQIANYWQAVVNQNDTSLHLFSQANEAPELYNVLTQYFTDRSDYGQLADLINYVLSLPIGSSAPTSTDVSNAAQLQQILNSNFSSMM